MPSAVRPRPRIDDSHLMRVASRLTERDRVIVRLLYEHRVLTSPQVRDIAFDSARRTEARLRVLYKLRVVDRFRPQRWRGSAPYHWVLDAAGAAVIAAEREVDVATLTWRRDRSLARQASASLDHRVGTNGFFTALIREARAHPGRRLAAWWPEWRCAAE